MAKEKKEWQEITEFSEIAADLIAKYPEKLGDIETEFLVCYGITNKEKPDGYKKRFDISAGKEPECFTNSKRVFVTFFQSEWDSRTDGQKARLVYDALRSIDTSVDPWKIRSCDYMDRAEMVRTFGPDWDVRDDLPNPLTDNVQFRE